MALLAGVLAAVFGDPLFTGQWYFIGDQKERRLHPRLHRVLIFDIGGVSRGFRLDPQPRLRAGGGRLDGAASRRRRGRARLGLPSGSCCRERCCGISSAWILISNAANLAIFTSGRLTEGAPPLIPGGESTPVDVVANALPQALVLTAIVIGFGLFAFTLVLIFRAWTELGTLDHDEMRLAEPREDGKNEAGSSRFPSPSPSPVAVAAFSRARLPYGALDSASWGGAGASAVGDPAHRRRVGRGRSGRANGHLASALRDHAGGGPPVGGDGRRDRRDRPCRRGLRAGGTSTNGWRTLAITRSTTC